MADARVVIDYRPGGRLLRSELSFVDPGDVPFGTVKALCRGLDRHPGEFTFQPDPKAKALRDEDARAFALDLSEQRMARIVGLSATWLTVAAAALGNRRWSPGLNREAV